MRDLALQLGGDDLWREIRSGAEVDDEPFLSMGTYSDDITYRLVESASSVLGLSSSEVLQAFGRHWILYTARQGYGPFFDTMGRSLPEFLANLDAMHARLSLSMPELRPPSFTCEQVNNAQIRLEYWSDRPDLAPMVSGLLIGLGELFELKLSVYQSVSRSAGADHDEFVVDYAPAVPSGDRGEGSRYPLEGCAVPRASADG